MPIPGLIHELDGSLKLSQEIRRDSAGGLGGTLGVTNRAGGVGAAVAVEFCVDNGDVSAPVLNVYPSDAEIKVLNTGGPDSDTTDMIFSTSNGNLTENVRIQGSTGNVGIGTTSPSSTLDVKGNVHVSGNLNVDGDVFLTAPAADFAEDFDVSDCEHILPGTVMVLDSDGGIQKSQQPYDKRVAGVISGAGKFRAAITLDKQNSSKRLRMPLALMGKVYCQVDAQYSSIEAGDLLTTSATPGYAMKASDPARTFGCIIGKALRSVISGRDLIPILVFLR